MVLFKLRNVKKVKNGKVIINQLNLEIPEEEVFIILGPSGSGKTSLLRLLVRLDDPDEGEIIYRDKNLQSIHPLELRREVGYVFQVPILLPGTVRDNLLLPAKYHNLEIEPVKYLKLVGLDEDFLEKDVSTLSTGQAQRIMLARALTIGPEVLLLDEPTSSLDFSTTLEIEKLLIELKNKIGLHLIFVTHNLEQALRLGGKGALIVQGKCVEEGDIEELFQKPKTKEMFDFIRGNMR